MLGISVDHGKNVSGQRAVLFNKLEFLSIEVLTLHQLFIHSCLLRNVYVVLPFIQQLINLQSALKETDFWSDKLLRFRHLE